MRKNRVSSRGRIVARAVLLTGILSCISAAGFSWAGTSVPVPDLKPEVFAPIDLASLPLPSHKPEINLDNGVQGIAYESTDLSSVLLDYGAPPVPYSKPVFIKDGPISQAESARYRKIFTLQSEGKINAANKEMAALEDMRLRGHVLYQRYMHPDAYTSSFRELYNWLTLYSDHPGADKIYTLAMRKLPSGFSGSLQKPEDVRGIARMRDPMMQPSQVYKSGKTHSASQKQQIKKLRSQALALGKKHDVAAIQNLLEGAEASALMDTVERDILKSKIASDLLYLGYPDEALELAKASVVRSGVHVPTANWVAGLASWDEGDYTQAAKYFEATARSPYASGWTAAAGAYWAARTHMRTGNVKAVSGWLKRSIEHPRTFYGLVATRALGRDFNFDWRMPEFTSEQQDILNRHPAGQRAMALAQAGQVHLAEAELLRLNVTDEASTGAMLSYAAYAGLPSLGLRLGSAISDTNGNYFDAALYPVGAWKPQGGYTVDPALVHAIMRQESRFDPKAQSPSGARGLMQIMPATAQYVAKRKKLDLGEDQYRLQEPETNLEIGQAYLESLLEDAYVGGDLVYLLIAYNAGPGNLAKWRKRWPNVHDPLLFVELIPSAETRAYVERVLANYWIYQMRGNQPTPTLEAIAEGKPARYAWQSEDQEGFKLAAWQK